MPGKNLAVFLNDFYVGVLTQLIDGRSVLAFDEKYLANGERPTLSLSYKNVLQQLNQSRDVVSSSGKLPAFFSNLLPEGQLRTYLARKAHLRDTQEFSLLAALCDDLPGAVRLVPEAGIDAQDEGEEESTALKNDGEYLRFSLAGVQLKFSGNLVNSKIVIPSRGVGGHWIVKLPSPGYPHVNELEYSMLTLASKVGIKVPEFKLAPLSNFENLPKDLPVALKGDCLLSKRFDRTDGGGRIHMEDFAQIFSIYDKYDEKFNYQSIANVLWIESGLDDVLEFVRRLVHMFLIGNADMHMKNWAVIYPDGKKARLSPAYDLVSTIVYPNIDRTLPHKMAGATQFAQIDLDVFKRFAKIANLPERPVLKTASETAYAIKDAWDKLSNDIPIPSTQRKLIGDQMLSVPLLKETY